MSIELWAARLERPLTEAEEAAMLALLPPERRERLLRLRQPEKRREPLCAYLMLRRALWEQFHWRDLPEIRTASLGKPFFPDHPEVHFNLSHTAGAVLVDGSGVGDVGAVVLRDRKILAEDGMVVVILNVQNNQLLHEPEIITRGFIYVKESEDLMRELRDVARGAAQSVIGRGGKNSKDMGELRGAVKSAVSSYLFKHTKRSPMVIPVVNKL